MNLEISLYDEENFKFSWDIPLDIEKGDDIFKWFSNYKI